MKNASCHVPENDNQMVPRTLDVTTLIKLCNVKLQNEKAYHIKEITHVSIRSKKILYILNFPYSSFFYQINK
jgi:hypothetical protein